MGDLAAVATHAFVLDGRHLTLGGRASEVVQSVALTPDTGSPIVAAVRDTWVEDDGSGFAATIDLTLLIVNGARTIRVTARADGREVPLRPIDGFDETPNDDLMSPHPVDPAVGVQVRPRRTTDGSLEIVITPLTQMWGVQRTEVVDDVLVVTGTTSVAATTSPGAVWLQSGDDTDRLTASIAVDGSRWSATVPTAALAAASVRGSADRVVWTVMAADSPTAVGSPLRPFDTAIRCLSVAHVKPRWTIDLGGTAMRLTVRYTPRRHLTIAVQRRTNGHDR